MISNCTNSLLSVLFLPDPVWKVGRYTAAAPLYFTECDYYVDGGVLANNPCSDALTRIQVDFRLPIATLFIIPLSMLWKEA